MSKAEKKHSRRDFFVEGGQKLAGLTLASSLLPLAACEAQTQSTEILVKEAPIPAETPMVRYDLDPAWPMKPESIGPFAGNPAIMVDARNQVWVSNRSFPAMQIYDTSGNFIRAWDSPNLFSETGPALSRNMEKGPFNLHFFRFDSVGNVWIANTNRHIIQKCDQDGNVLLTIGTPDMAGTDETHMSRPTDMTITPAGIFISDGYGNRRVVHYSADGKYIKTWGQEGTGTEDFIDPHAICHIGEHLYVVDRGNMRIKVYDFEGKLLDIWRDLILPWPLIPTANNEIWTCGVTPVRTEEYSPTVGGRGVINQMVMKFSAEGKILQMYGFPVSERTQGEHVPGKLNMMHGMAVDQQGNLYLGEAFNPGPQKWTRSTEIKTQAEGEYPVAPAQGGAAPQGGAR